MPGRHRLLPFDKDWKDRFTGLPWPGQALPHVAGNVQDSLALLLREYLFVSVYKACAESMTAENASRFRTMQRAEKNIGDRQRDMRLTNHRLRQEASDEELFDVEAGFEALKHDPTKTHHP